MFYDIDPDPIRVGQTGSLRISLDQEEPGQYWFQIRGEETPFLASETDSIKQDMERDSDFQPEVQFAEEGELTVWHKKSASATPPTGGWTQSSPFTTVLPQRNPEPAFAVALAAEQPPISDDEVLWRFIRANSQRLRFDEFRDAVQPQLPKERSDWYGVNAYETLVEAARKFLQRAAAPVADNELSQATINGALRKSYVHNRPSNSKPFLEGNPPPLYEGEDGRGQVLLFPFPNVPFVELIWNYWTEEGMLVQTLNHILARFQNRRPEAGGDALTRLDLSPLMPLRALMWGFAEDETSRLTIRRRNAEYEYEYGLRLRGRAIQSASTLVDRRGQFLEGFHRLLHACVEYFKERDDKTVDADAFPLLSNLQEVHLSLARGAHNQFADLSVTARAEMLTMQWLLAQPEMHEFLGGPVMVPYEEPWMDRVDTMKRMQGWSDASVTHFFELAVQGEQILLSVRHGRWNESTRKREHAANWALVWRNEIQRYIHSYATVTGVDLAVKVDATMPSELLSQRLTQQRRRA